MFQVNDTVRVRRPEHVQKGLSRFTAPLTIVKKVGLNTYLLSDGRKWNASKLTRFPRDAMASNSDDNDNMLDKDVLDENVLDELLVPENILGANAALNAREPAGPRRNLRARNQPRWLADYVR